jgi:hypothetical protein
MNASTSVFGAGCDSQPAVKPATALPNKALIRLNSVADSKVWMKEDGLDLFCLAPIAHVIGFFYL